MPINANYSARKIGETCRAEVGVANCKSEGLAKALRQRSKGGGHPEALHPSLLKLQGGHSFAAHKTGNGLFQYGVAKPENRAPRKTERDATC